MSRSITSMLNRLIDNSRSTARSTSVFGTPLVSERATVVPVARVSVLNVFGGTSCPDTGGGISLTRARPAGMIVLDGEGSRFLPIRQTATALALPLALITAVTVTRVVGVSMREARRRRATRLREGRSSGPTETTEDVSDR